MTKILILKMGYSEFLDKESNSRKVSLGDVLRTTVLLHLFKNDDVTWVTDIESFPLLEGNPYIKRLLPYDLTTVLHIEAEEFDVVINLEKVPGICAWADKIKAWKKYGFRFDSKTGKAEAYDRAFDVLAVSSNPESKKLNERTAQELLFELVGQKWQGENYILGYKPESFQLYDIGLNTQVGQKWPTKSWPSINWDKLESMLKSKGYKVTRQDKENPEILKDLKRYADWINSCKMIITNDSLGLHLGIALNKKIIALFGPTAHKEIPMNENTKILLPEAAHDCMPCFKGKCDKYFNSSCISLISPERVLEEIEKTKI